MSEFKKDEYIVITKGNHRSFKTNYCFKQREDLSTLRVYADCGGHENGIPLWQHSVTSSWRYATESEMIEYDTVGKPYNTLLLKDKVNFKVGDIVKIVKRTANSINKIGEIGVIHSIPILSCPRVSVQGRVHDCDYESAHNIEQLSLLNLDNSEAITLLKVEPLLIDFNELRGKVKLKKPKTSTVTLGLIKVKSYIK